MSLVKIIKDDLAKKDHGEYYREYASTLKAFEQVESFLDEKKIKSVYFPRCRVALSNIYGRFSYDTSRGFLRVLMPSFIHASCVNWLVQWVESMKQLGDIGQKGVSVVVDATLKGFTGAYYGR
jgi:hypothetical protein